MFIASVCNGTPFIWPQHPLSYSAAIFRKNIWGVLVVGLIESLRRKSTCVCVCVCMGCVCVCVEGGVKFWGEGQSRTFSCNCCGMVKPRNVLCQWCPHKSGSHVCGRVCLRVDTMPLSVSFPVFWNSIWWRDASMMLLPVMSCGFSPLNSMLSTLHPIFWIKLERWFPYFGTFFLSLYWLS